MCNPYFWKNIVFKCSSSEQYRNGKNCWRNKYIVVCVAFFCCFGVVFLIFILLFVKCTISAGKETKEILGPEAQTGEAGCTGISLLVWVIKCYWILARWLSFWNLWNSPTSLYKLLCSSTLEVLSCKQCFIWGRIVWAPFGCPGSGGVADQWHGAVLSREAWPQRRCSTASPKSKTRNSAHLTRSCIEYKYRSIGSVLN